jgi:hypothetical protein
MYSTWDTSTQRRRIADGDERAALERLARAVDRLLFAATAALAASLLTLGG